MSELSVKMSLTLADAASGPLRAFTQMLEGLKGVSAGIAKQLDGITAAIGSINRVAGATSLNSFAAGIERVGVVSGEARGGTAGLEQAIAALGATISGVAGRLGAMTAELGALGTEARAAGAGVKSGAAQMESGLVSANTQANTLTSTLKGLGQLYAAMKIEQGLKESAKEAINYQATQTRMATMGMSATERAEMTHAADAASKAVPQFNRDETLSMAIDLRNATGSVEHALGMLQPFAVAAFNMKMATPAGKTFAESDMLLIAKALEQRGATMDPVKMQAELSMIERIYTATQGRVDAQQILGNIQYAKGGLGQTMDLSFLPIFAAMIEQIKSAGGNGGQIGTALTSLQQAIINGTGSGQAQKERARLGLLDPDKLVWNKQGNIDQQKSDLKMAGAEEFQRNPYLWIQNYLKPAMVRAGIDLTNDAAVNQTLNKLFPNRNAANIAGMMTNRGALLEKDAANINQSKAGQDAREINVETAKANIEAFKAQLANLGIVLGTTLLPAVTVLAKAFTEMFQGLAEFFTAHPAAATFLTYAAAIGAVVLAVQGFRNVFGVLGSFSSLLTGVGAAAGGAAAATTAGATSILGRLAAIAGGLLKLAAAFEIGQLIGSIMLGWLGPIQVAGVQITTWIGGWIDGIVTTVANGWIRTKQFFGLMSKAAADAQVAANNAEQNAAWRANTEAGPNNRKASGAVGDFNANYGNEGRRTPLSIAKAAGAGLFGTTTSPGKTGGGKTSKYNPDADAAGNEFKQEEDDLRNNIKVMDALYKEGLVSVENYYIGKQAALEVAVEAELAALNRERDAFVKAKNQAGINRVDTQIAAVQNKLETGTEQNDAARKEAIKKLDKEALEVQRDMLTTSGQRRVAELQRIQDELKGKLDVLVLNGRLTQSEADAMMAKSKAAVEYKQQYTQIAQVQQDYSDKQAQIESAERNGTLSQTAATEQKFQLRKAEAAQLDVLIAKLRELAVASGDDKALLELDKLSTKNASAKNELPADQIELLKTAQSGFQGFFRDVLSGTQSAENAFRRFGKTIENTVLDIVSKKLGDMLFDSLFGGGGKSGSGGGGWLGGLLGGGGGGGGGGFGSLFGGGNLMGSMNGWFSSMPGFGMLAASGGTSAISTMWGTGSSVGGVGFGTGAGVFGMQDIGAFLDDGTDYVPHDMLAMIHKGEKVTPADYNPDNPSNRNAGGGGMDGATFHNTFAITGAVDRRSQGQIVAELQSMAQRATTRRR